MLGSYVKAHGRPLAVYTDKASLFQTTPRRRIIASAGSSPRRSGGRSGTGH